MNMASIPPPPPPTILSQFTTSTPSSHECISLLPLHIAFSGPAQISSYFQPRPHATSTSHALEAAFRGRLVVGKDLAVPEGYTGVVLKSMKPIPRETVDASELDQRAHKKAKTVVQTTRTKTTTTVASSAVMGSRRSPRQKVVVQQFSMDEDAEEEEAALDNGEGPAAMDVDASTVLHEAEEVIIDDTVSTSLIMPLPSHSIVTSLAVSAHPLSASSSFAFSSPATPTLTTSSFPNLLLDAEAEAKPEAEVEPENEDEEVALARDIQYLVPCATFDSLRIWHADYELDLEEDVYGRAVSEWIGVSKMIHAY